MNRTILYCLLALWMAPASGQAISGIPAGLTENAHSVVIDNQIEFICESTTSAVKKESVTISVLNEKGLNGAFFFIMCDKFSNLRKFSGEILDRTGRTIRKLKKSDLQMTEFSSGLTSDDYSYFYDCKGPSYPFTVTYEWEIKYKDGLIAFPVFAPQKLFNQSVVNASYRLFFSPDVPYRYKSVFTDAKPEKKDNGKASYEEITLKNLKAFEAEPYGPSLSGLIPRVYFDPVRFFFDGKEGSMESWQAYGLWQNDLLKGRDQLPEEFRNQLKEMTAHCANDREKVKMLYDYLGETTRYVSIQLGIGGFQPMEAERVHSARFGDCKGLSNYMLAMLKAIGIPSCYTEISTTQSRFIKDYMNVRQTNHVILQVPLPNDTLWLECTNPKLPFGYIHTSIAGHDALLIKENGGEVCRLPAYPDSLNIQHNNIQVNLSNEGGASVQVEQRSHLCQYESKWGITQLSPEKQREHLTDNIRLNKISIKDLQINENKEADPYIDVHYSLNTGQYGSKTGSRLFIPVNPFRGIGKLSEKNRVNDIYINNGYIDTDEITIRIPEDYEIESLPKPAIISNEFGSFVSFLRFQKSEITVEHRLHMKKGKYPKEKYDDFVRFHKVISGQYSEKIILRKRSD